MTEAFSLDKATILDRLGGDDEIFAVMADMYVHDVEGYCLQLEDALQAGDAGKLYREAHTVKGLLATLADPVGAEQAGALEMEARLGGDVSPLAAAVAGVQARLRLVAEALKADRS